jgi:hypothetical protein
MMQGVQLQGARKGQARWPAQGVRDHRAPQRPLPCRLLRLHCVRWAAGYSTARTSAPHTTRRR